MTLAIRVVLTRDAETWPKGTELGFEDEAAATKTLGEGAFKVVSHVDGSPYEASKAAAEPAKKD